MKKLGVKVKILNPDAIVPKYQTEEAAGFDLHSIEEKTIKAKERDVIKTGLAANLQPQLHVGREQLAALTPRRRRHRVGQGIQDQAMPVAGPGHRIHLPVDVLMAQLTMQIGRAHV